MEWTYNETDVMQREDDFSLTPLNLNHNLTIDYPTTDNSGVYTCRAAIDADPFEQNITVTVIAGMCNKMLKLNCM